MGASRGIGAATAKALAVAGAEVVLSVRREDRLKALAREITESGGHAVVKVLQSEDIANAILYVVTISRSASAPRCRLR